MRQEQTNNQNYELYEHTQSEHVFINNIYNIRSIIKHMRCSAIDNFIINGSTHCLHFFISFLVLSWLVNPLFLQRIFYLFFHYSIVFSVNSYLYRSNLFENGNKFVQKVQRICFVLVDAPI